MKKIIGLFLPLMILLSFVGMALVCAPNYNSGYRKAKPLPCITHKPVDGSPLLTKVYISGAYNMHDLQGTQQNGQLEIIDILNGLTYGKYQLANGVTPNLSLYVTFTTDYYEHYGAQVHGYVYDGDFYFSLDNNYTSVDKLFNDIYTDVNTYINNGWCSNCPGKCVVQ